MKNHAIYLVLMALVFLVGVRLGGEALYTKNAEHEAAMRVAKLKYLDKEDYAGLRSLLDDELNHYLLAYVRDKDNILHRAWPRYESDSPESLVIAATYRKQNPSPKPDEKILEIIGGDAQYVLSDLAEIEKIAITYGD